MILLIDNYDSFTWNLAHLIGELGETVDVRRNDSLTAKEALALKPEAIILSPGPCTPKEAGISVELVRLARETDTPLFGVCLGLQSIADAYGGRIVRAATPMHGKTSEVRHDGSTIFAGIPETFTATRYHSLVAAKDAFPNTLQATAWATDDTEIMALQDPERPIFGVQFHPESIASEHGAAMIRNFLSAARSNGGAKS